MLIAWLLDPGPRSPGPLLVEERVNFAPLDIWSIPARRQPRWSDPAGVVRVRALLAEAEPLVRADDVARLRALLGTVARGEALVAQSGDHAEDPDECDP